MRALLERLIFYRLAEPASSVSVSPVPPVSRPDLSGFSGLEVGVVLLPGGVIAEDLEREIQHKLFINDECL